MDDELGGANPWRATGEVCDDLTGQSGAWLVTTRGSRHLWEIGEGGIYWTRLPGDGSAAFDDDGNRVRLTRVPQWPRVGERSLVWFDDLESPWAVEQWRLSSTIVRIERVERQVSDDGVVDD